jgi:hypothetical protein
MTLMTRSIGGGRPLLGVLRVLSLIAIVAVSARPTLPTGGAGTPTTVYVHYLFNDIGPPDATTSEWYGDVYISTSWKVGYLLP